MSAVEGGSVPPPGWVEPKAVVSSSIAAGHAAAAVSLPVAAGGTAAAVSVPVAVTAPQSVSGQPAAEAAVEWRINAAIVDGLVISAVYGLICLALHWQFFTVTHQLVCLGLNIAYYFTLEARDGQTIGKQLNGVRVVSIDGSPAAPKAIAIRSALRVVDVLPIWYLSGLINMVRTGPERRQRIGDVAAETKVIAVGGNALRRGTRGWVLPTVTLLALLISAADVIAIANAGNRPLNSVQQAQFVTSCASGTDGKVNCQCLLSRLEADGYTSANDLNTLMAQARSEELTGQTGAARTELVNDTRACLE